MNKTKKRKHLRIIVIVSLIVVLAISFSAIWLNTKKKDAANNLPANSQPVVMAHRGYFVNAVENTLGSLDAAAAFKPDYVELDVVESADGELFVIHDNNLKRLAGLDKDIRKMNREEVKSVILKQNGKESRISTLSEFVDEAIKLDQNLNVEIKIYGKESTDFVGNVVNLLKSKNVENKYLIQSLDWDTVLKVNELAPEISAGFIALNKTFDINNAGIDFISIPVYDVAKDLLSHKDVTNKPIYVWTIDSEASIEKVFSEGANGVITNRCNEAIIIRDQMVKKGSIN
ncbi:MAG: glycerophosphodiester phosphodiesterase family protein [Eubacteriales bacterium]